MDIWDSLNEQLRFSPLMQSVVFHIVCIGACVYARAEQVVLLLAALHVFRNITLQSVKGDGCTIFLAAYMQYLFSSALFIIRRPVICLCLTYSCLESV